MRVSLAISLGDITGIGPEVTLKALAAEAGGDDTRYLLIGDESHLRALAKRLGLMLPLQREDQATDRDRFLIAALPPSVEAPSLNPPLAAGAAPAARAAVAWLAEGGRRCLANAVDGLVTAPVSKEAIMRSGIAFVGQTEFLAGMAGTERAIMMLLGTDDRGRWLRVALATTHVPLRLVAEQLTQAKVELAIQRAAQACRDLRLPRARVAVCGLNPHAGEGGKLGTEEQTVIIPAVASTRGQGGDVVGPLAADTLFHYAYRGDYDAVVAMYHDQGLAPLKMIAFETGVNWTLGLPFVRTSPDHGTAYDIAGQGMANPASMRSALRLARELALQRKSLAGLKLKTN
jgi:4-phospho-D-threonate 3-dehydrogenase / 4-phospho-D-erythronate 3-dehydrogenase